MKRLLTTILCALCCAIGMAQWNTDRITAIGRNALHFEDYVLSIQYFNQVIKIKPYLSEPYQLRAIAKLQLGDDQGALRDCNETIRLNPFQPQSYYIRGFIYRRMGMFAEAENDFTHALSFSPENKTYMVLRADVRQEQKNYEGAMQDLNQLLQREPHSPSLLFEKGVVLLRMTDTLAARTCFEQTTLYDTQNAQNWSALGMVQLMLRQDNEALSALTRSINLGSTWAGDYINRGIIFYRKHDFRNALADYDKAVLTAPRDAQCYYNRAILRSELGDYNRAIEDYNQAISLDPDATEMRYQRGTTLLQLGQWDEAKSDFDALIARYPNFLPAYYLAAQAETALGHSKQAYVYRHQADEREKMQNDSVPNTGNAIAQTSGHARDRRKEFNTRTAQNGTDENDSNSDHYASEVRGAIQHADVEIRSENSITLSYYGQNPPMRRTNYYHYAVEQLNQSGILAAPLKFIQQETNLSADMIAYHFEAISTLTQQIEAMEKQRNPQAMSRLYIRRAMEFSLVKDYGSAMDDCTRAINAFSLTRREQNDRDYEALAAFMRANWRYRLLDYQRSTGELTEASPLDFQVMMRDYDFCIQNLPDFSFAYYNKANILCIQREYAEAIRLYSQAIEQDNEFAEAYFNRGLTRIYFAADHDEESVRLGLEDLSRAGELGIYQAYNIISRLK